MAKRVNKNFLIVFIVVIGFGAAGLFGAAWWYHRRHDPAKFIREAQKAVAEKRYLDATGWYKAAIGTTKDEDAKLDLMVKLGDTHDAAVAQDPSFRRNARGWWNAALEIRPKYKPALERLLNTWIEQMKLTGSNDPGLFATIHDVADRASKYDRNDLKAAEWLHMASIQQWLSGPAIVTQDVKDDMAALTALIKQDPTNADLPFYLGRAKLRQAMSLTTAGRRELADPIYTEVAHTYDDLVQKYPQSGPMQLRAHEVYSLIEQIEPDPDRKAHATG